MVGVEVESEAAVITHDKSGDSQVEVGPLNSTVLAVWRGSTE